MINVGSSAVFFEDLTLSPLPISPEVTLPINVHALELNRLEGAINKTALLSGIPEKHLFDLHTVASNNNCIIIFRPIDRHNVGLIDENHPTKGLDVKGKSADWGPQYGFVCIDQRLSKLENNPAKAREASEQILLGIGPSHRKVQAIDLVVSHARLKYLEDQSIIRCKKMGSLILIDSVGHSGSFYRFTAKLTTLPPHGYLISNDEGVIKVLAPRLSKKSDMVIIPFFADYDLLAVMPHIRDYDKTDKRKLSFSGPSSAGPCEFKPSLCSSLINPALVNLVRRNSEHAVQLQARSGDYTTARELKIIAEINRALRPPTRGDLANYGEFGNLVQHGADEGNPHSAPDSNYPATAISPLRMNIEPVEVFAHDDQMGDFIARASLDGYRLEGNAAWSEKLKMGTVFSKRLAEWERRSSIDSTTSSVGNMSSSWSSDRFSSQSPSSGMSRSLEMPMPPNRENRRTSANSFTSNSPTSAGNSPDFIERQLSLQQRTNWGLRRSSILSHGIPENDLQQSLGVRIDSQTLRDAPTFNLDIFKNKT